MPRIMQYAHLVPFLVTTVLPPVFHLTLAVLVVSATAPLVAGPWRWRGPRRRTGLLLAGAMLAFGVADVGLLAALPRLGLSYGRDWRFPAVAALGLHILLLWVCLAACSSRRLAHRNSLSTWASGAFVALSSTLVGAQVYAYLVEPFWLETTMLDLRFNDLNPEAPPVRVVHLTDLHIERFTGREAALIEEINRLNPDLITISGDHINLSYLDDPIAISHFQALMNQLHPPYGIWATRGSVEPQPEQMARLVAGTEVHWLENEHVTLNVRGQPITLLGVATSHNLDVDIPRLDQAMAGIPGDAFTLLIYHSPDLIEAAAARGVDLYVSGHTHGGQIALPWHGALVTASIYGKAYEHGLYRVGPTTMVVSRGIGFEGGPMPRARFFARPEIVALTLH